MKHFTVLFAFLILIVGNIKSETINITVTKDTMQHLRGLGFSIHRAKDYFLSTDPIKSDKIFNGTFPYFNSMVFWSYIEEPLLRDQLINKAKNHGLKYIIVNPTGYPKTSDEHALNTFKEIDEYMKSGYPIYGTTLMNKPNTDESDTYRQDPKFLTQCTKRLRFMLDSAGYKQIKIGGPSTIEWSPYIDPTKTGAAHGYSFQTGDNKKYLQAFLDDKDALKALDAIDFQSYGWSISEETQHLADSLGKELWVTLSATDGKNNKNFDWILGPISSANLLSNLNHGVVTWNYWVWDQLIGFTPNADPSPRMQFLKLIGGNLKENALFRKCKIDSSEPTPDMFWNFYDMVNPSMNKQPEIVAASAQNPDSTHVFIIQSLSGIQAQHFNSQYLIANAKDKHVRVTMEEMSQVPGLIFNVTKIDKSLNLITNLKDTMYNGTMDIFLKNTELIVFKSAEKFTPVSTHVLFAEKSDFTIYPNPSNGNINLKSNSSNTNYLIYHSNGQIIKTGKTKGGIVENIDLTNYPKGFYIIKVGNQSEKILIQ